jgi:Amt family ammonium transporter
LPTSVDLGVGLIANSSFHDVTLAAVLIAGAVLPGAWAERMSLWPALVASAVFGAIVMPVVVLWTRMDVGWLTCYGVLGIGPVLALTGAAFAAAGAWRVGAREGKYHRDGSASPHPRSQSAAGHRRWALMALALFAIGAAHGQDANASPELALAAGGLVAAVVTHVRLGKPDVGLILVGVIGASLAACVTGIALTPWKALVVGAIAGLVVPHVAFVLETRWRLDDPTSGIGTWAAAVAWGMVAGAILSVGGVEDKVRLVLWQVVGIVILAGWGGLTGW